jgi:hypothetical protein
MLIDAALVSVDMQARIVAPHIAHIRAAQSRKSGPAAIRLAADRDDPVITPGGPRPRSQVHHVRPDEVVRRNDDGSYSIVPREAPAGPKSSDDGDKGK